MDLAIPFRIDTSMRRPYDASGISICSEIGVLVAVRPEIGRCNEVCWSWRSEIRFVRKCDIRIHGTESPVSCLIEFIQFADSIRGVAVGVKDDLIAGVENMSGNGNDLFAGTRVLHQDSGRG